MKRILLIAFALTLLASSVALWVGYGNPFREIPFHNYEPGEDISHLFYVSHCREDGICEIEQEHERVLHLGFGGHRGGFSPQFEGDGNNPIAILRGIGLSVLPQPDYAEAAIKWCASSDIVREFRHHGLRLYSTPLTDNPEAIVSCIKNQMPGSFSACVADPPGRAEDCERFVSIADGS